MFGGWSCDVFLGLYHRVGVETGVAHDVNFGSMHATVPIINFFLIFNLDFLIILGLKLLMLIHLLSIGPVLSERALRNKLQCHPLGPYRSVNVHCLKCLVFATDRLRLLL